MLLGSSARKLKQAGTNLFAGRALRRLMLPLLPAELGPDFDLAAVLRFGSLTLGPPAGPPLRPRCVTARPDPGRPLHDPGQR